MEFAQIMQIVQLAIQYGPTIKTIWDEATSNHEVVQKVTNLAPTIGNVIADLGSQLFPHSTKDLQTIGAVVAAFDPNTTKWLQKSLNQILGTKLTVDGIYGAQTIEAVKALQTKYHLAVDGIAGKVTQAIITGNLPKAA